MFPLNITEKLLIWHKPTLNNYMYTQNCCKPLTNFYHKMFHRHEGDSNSQLLVVIKAQIAQVVVNPTTIWSLTWRPRYIMGITSYIQWYDNAVQIYRIFNFHPILMYFFYLNCLCWEFSVVCRRNSVMFYRFWDELDQKRKKSSNIQILNDEN
jgi:hypothetical protein